MPIGKVGEALSQESEYVAAQLISASVNQVRYVKEMREVRIYWAPTVFLIPYKLRERPWEYVI